MKVGLWRWGEPVQNLRDVIGRGGIVVVPTESSYGLGVDPASETGVQAIYEVKVRDRGKPLPVVIGDLDQAVALGVALDAPGLEVLARLWPAPVSLLVPTSRALPAAAGTGMLAIRVPAHRRLRELLLELGGALTATSANRSGEPPLLDALDVQELLAGRDAVVVAGEVLAGGAPSTVVSWAAGALRVVRPGRISEGHLRRMIDEIQGRFSAAGVEITVDKSHE